MALLAASEKAWSATLESYQHGLSTFPDVRESTRNLERARTAHQAARGRRGPMMAPCRSGCVALSLFLGLRAAGAGVSSAVARDPNDPATWGKVGRNESCPCGSGKKYKHCHGRFA